MRNRSSVAAILSLAAWALPALAQEHSHDGAGTGNAAAAAREKPVAWTRYPVLLAGMREGRGAVGVRAGNLEALVLDVFAPGPDVAAGRRQLPLAGGGATVTPPHAGKGNYHWLMAREETDGVVRVASTAHYFSNPGPSPEEVLVAPKSELEIVPHPLPREHSMYRESEKWSFLVRYDGRALENKAVVLETESGSRVTMTTNSLGMASVVFPRDMGPAKNGENEHRPRPAKFVLGVEHEADGKRYVTAFNYAYGRDPDRSRSLDAGLGFLVLGMACAAPLLRRRQNAPENTDHA